ncbi:CoA ligase [Archaeoglobales archaeon ex4484_92]|nr:MAG: CoA ligase [Archaeoglobales archaeon ex4484_92]
MEREFWDPEIERMKRDELEKLQLKKLKWQVERVYKYSEFYRERFKEAGVKPEDIKKLEDVSKLPITTKADLRMEQSSYPPLGRYAIAPKSDWKELHPSTGTTGIPVNTVWSFKDAEVIADHTARLLWGFGVRKDDIVQNAFSYGLWVAGIAVHYGCEKIGAFVIPIGATSSERQVYFMQNAGSTVILATPSFGLYIAEKLKEKGANPEELPLRIGSFGGEAGTENPATRRRLEQGLGIDAYDIYGLAEIGPTFAAECSEKAGLHFVEDHYLLEVLDPKTKEPLGPGEEGVLAITHLSREATPMIRYWTNDIVKLEYEKCGCGRTHVRAIGGILGRADDMIVFKGENIYPTQVEEVVRSFNELSNEYKIFVKKDSATGIIKNVKVSVEATSEEYNFDELRERVAKSLRDALLVRVDVEVLPPNSLERTEFKAKRVFLEEE